VSEAAVLDGSAIVSLILQEDGTQAVQETMDALDRQRVHLLAPRLWSYEVASTLLIAEKRGRTNLSQVTQSVIAIEALGVQSVDVSSARLFREVLPLGRQYGLTVYDASYLDLALSEGAVLVSLDRQLRVAAQSAGVTVLPLSLPPI